MVRRSFVVAAFVTAFLSIAAPALACGGLVNSNGSVTLVRTTTMAAYHDGIEHYVTSFQFAGGEGEFGSIIPLPGVPTKVIRGGDWTLQRLVLETQPQERALAPEAFAAADTAGAAEVILKTTIDALDVVVLKGGSDAVGTWAIDHGFFLPPDAPEVLDFYARRSPIFMAVRFDADRAAAQGLQTGDGTPVHVVIPTDNPWVPLRILGLGAGAIAPVEGDVYLLTDRAPALLPAPVGVGQAQALTDAGVRPGLVLERSEAASPSLLSDLRSDKGMDWLPADDMWLSYLRVDAEAGRLDFDLAVDASGAGRPSPVDAGLTVPGRPAPQPTGGSQLVWIVAAVVSVLAFGTWVLSRRPTGRPA
jgi:hypothetical protein